MKMSYEWVMTLNNLKIRYFARKMHIFTLFGIFTNKVSTNVVTNIFVSVIDRVKICNACV